MRAAALLLVLLAAPASAQMAPSSARTVPLSVSSGLHDGAVGFASADTASADSLRLAYQAVVRVEGARWLRLRFGRLALGTRSVLRLTSLEDGAEQHLDARAAEAWRLTSAFFNGDAVRLELLIAPGDAGVTVDVAEASAGEPPPASATICGTADNRAASTEQAVGRLTNATGGLCTGWLISSGAFLAAGHCTGTDVLQFNVPASDADGSLNMPDPEDQYAVNAFVFEAVPRPSDPTETVIGQDWMVFSVAPNTETGQVPGPIQGAFHRVTESASPTSFRVTGHGVDDGTANGTQQTHTGSNEGETVEDANWAYWQHRADTRGGNSGSAIRLTDQLLAVGIHTHGGCTEDGGANAGTSFESNDLAAAIDDFFGTAVVHLDSGHPFALGNGTPFRPHATFPAAVAAVPAGGSIRAVTGTYTVGAGVYSKAMTWVAPVGPVVIQ